MLLLAGVAVAWACTNDAAAPAGLTGSAGASGKDASAGTGEGGSVSTGDHAGGAGALGTAGAGGAVEPDGGAGSGDASRGDAAARDTAGAADAGRADTGGHAGTGASAAGTIVPLYTYPTDASWTTIVTARKAHPAVHVVAIVNPDSGPGSSKDSAFTAGIAKLVAANIQVIGYVATGYASHSLVSMEAAIDQWTSFYPQIQGIFFDEQSDQAGDVAYYRTLSQYAKAKGLTYTVGNPGTDTAEAFVGALDTMLIYESKGLPALSTLGGWHTKYPANNFGVIPYGTPFDAGFVQQARQYVGYIYLQNDDLPNPWDTLPAYFEDLLAALE